ncbi:MAG TPA: hypothetical protein VMV20_04345 [Chitinophagaceae bacterium]|nr:hypothetical protein [Chitinophagaceae bacterium]
MKRGCLVLLILFLVPCRQGKAQLVILELIKKGVTKAIQAMDLKVQKMQNEQIALQVAEKQAENLMVSDRLQEIRSWLNSEQSLQASWFAALHRPGPAVLNSGRLSRYLLVSQDLASESLMDAGLVRLDPHFTVGEKTYLSGLFGKWIGQSRYYGDLVDLVLRPGDVQMDDAGRMELIREASLEAGKELEAMRDFFRKAERLSLLRSRDSADMQTIRRLYGISGNPSTN